MPSTVYWKRVRPRSLRHAIELCSKYALDKKHCSVERIAELMGLTSHWTLYKYMENGRMPACLIRSYEHACGCTYITKYIAASANKLLCDIPTGKAASESTVLDLNTAFNEAVNLLSKFYQGGADVNDTIDALTSVMCDIAHHRENISKSAAPELDMFSEDEE